MPKPVQRVSEARPRQAVFAASIKQFPKRLVIITSRFGNCLMLAAKTA